MKTSIPAASLAAIVAATLSGCGSDKPAPEAPRTVRTAEIRYDKARETNRYVGTVQARHQVDQAFRVGGKVVERKVEVGQAVRAGDVLAILDDTDYRLAQDAAAQQSLGATTQARQAESDRHRLNALKGDGSVSASEEERAQTAARTAQAAAEAETSKLELARNRLKYTVLRASQSGVVTAVRFETGQVVAEGQPVLSIANEVEPEILVDVPEDQLAAFKSGRFRASLASAPGEAFDVTLRELSPQAAQVTRTFRARMKPSQPRRLPLGSTATLVAEREGADASVALIPASAITQSKGQPALWIVRREGAKPMGAVALTPVTVHGYRNEEVLVSGPAAGDLVVTAGVQKMAPGLNVAMAPAAQPSDTKQASR